MSREADSIGSARLGPTGEAPRAPSTLRHKGHQAPSKQVEVLCNGVTTANASDSRSQSHLVILHSSAIRGHAQPASALLRED
eukprot:1156235-Pelagomonas_calceolata.AAC.8